MKLQERDGQLNGILSLSATLPAITWTSSMWSLIHLFKHSGLSSLVLNKVNFIVHFQSFLKQTYFFSVQNLICNRKALDYICSLIKLHYIYIILLTLN